MRYQKKKQQKEAADMTTGHAFKILFWQHLVKAVMHSKSEITNNKEWKKHQDCVNNA